MDNISGSEIHKFAAMVACQLMCAAPHRVASATLLGTTLTGCEMLIPLNANPVRLAKVRRRCVVAPAAACSLSCIRDLCAWWLLACTLEVSGRYVRQRARSKDWTIVLAAELLKVMVALSLQMVATLLLSAWHD